MRCAVWRCLRGAGLSPRPWRGTLNREARAKALRLRMYVLCSESARLIDLAEGNRQQRDVEAVDLVRHAAEEHSAWLEMLDIRS